MNFKLQSAAFKFFILTSLGFLFIYLILRGIYVPLVHDEAATFFHYIIEGNFIPPNAHWDANNHILNSALTYFSYLILGSSEIALRLPNILSFLLFLFFTYKISTEISNRLLQLVFIVSLVFAHNFIEFFALTRGYGMSMGFIFGSIWFLMNVLKESSLKYYFLTLFFMTLAILANLTLMNTAIIIIALLCANILLKFKNYSPLYSIKAMGLIISLGIVPIAMLIWLLLEFKKRGRLYYGTLDGFWELTMRSLTKLLTGSDGLFQLWLVILYFLITLTLFFYLIIKQNSLKSLWYSYNVFFVLLIGNLMASFILGNYFGINYPEDRTGLYFFPLFIGAFIFLLDQVSLNINRKVILLIVLPFLFFPIHFIYSLNLTHSSLWSDERIPKSFYKKVLDNSDHISGPNTIGGYHMRLLCWAYLNYRNGGELNQIQSSNYPEYISDYQVVELKKEEKWNEYYETLGYDPISKLSLLKRRRFIESKKLDNAFILSSGVTDQEYYNLYVGKTDTLDGKTLIIKIDMTLNSEAYPFEARTVAQIKDKNNKSLEYEFITLNWKRASWSGQNRNFSGSMIIYNLPEESNEIVLYLWNVSNKKYVAEDINCSINQLLNE